MYITPPEGVKIGASQEVSDEGRELLDTEDGEIPFDCEFSDNSEEEDEEEVPEDNEDKELSAPPQISAGLVSLPIDTGNTDFNNDAKMAQDLGELFD